MKEALNKVITESDQLNFKTVDLFINSQLISLTGNWEWDMLSESVYCSDVILALPADYIGTKGIIHPDDLNKVKKQLALFTELEFINIEFRMITTYNEVKKLSCTNCSTAPVNEILVPSPVREFIVSTVTQKRFEKGYELFNNVKETVDFAEKLTKTATWFNNTHTNETYYSDNVFRMHAVSPQSLNSHLHTFTHFIHPDDAVAVNDAFDAAYRSAVPIVLEYRIITANGREKYLSLTTQWAHNFKGELILNGLLQDRTDARVTEQKIERSENDILFQKALLQFNEQAGNTGYWQVNLLTRQTYYSDNYYRIHGVKPQSIPAAANIFNNYIHPDDREKVVAAFMDMRKEHIAPDLEYKIVRPDGKLRYVIQKGQLLSYGGELIITGTIRDITPQVNIEQKLEEHNQNGVLKDFAHTQSEMAAEISTWVQDMKTGDVFWSDNMYNLLGFKKSIKELTFNQLHNSVLPEHRKKFNDEITMAAEAGERQFEFSILRTGEVRNIKAVCKIINTDGKRIFTGTLQDVTDQKVLEQQLFEGSQLNQLLTQNILDSVFITDINNRIILWNRKCEQVFRYKKDEVIDRNYFDVFPEKKTDVIISRFNTVLKGDMIHEPQERTALKEYHDLNMIPLKDREGKVFGILHVMHEITRELQLRNNLTDRLHFIEKLMEETVDRIIVVDRNFHYIYWNKKAEEHYRINKEYVIGKNLLEVFPDMVSKPLYQKFKRALKGETVYEGSDKLDKWDGEEGDEEYIETYLIPLLNERKEVTSILWIVHDLTKEVQLTRHQTEATKQIEHSKNVLDSVFNASLHGIILYKAVRDKEGEIQDFKVMLNNEVTRKWNGRDLVGKLFTQEFPQIKDDGPFDAYKKVLSTGEPVNMEVLYDIKGVKRWYNISAVKVNDDELVATAEDITHRKRSEEDLKESKGLLQQTTLATPDSITVYDLEKKIPLYLNNCLAGWLGYTNAELMKMSFEERLQFIHPDDRDKLLQFNTTLASASEDKVIRIQYRIKSKDDKTMWIKNRSKPFRRNSKGKVIQILSVLQDVTENKNNEAELEQQRDRLIEAQRIAHLGNFEYSMSNNTMCWSDELYNIYGLEKTEVITKEKLLELTHPDDRELVSQYLNGSQKAGEEEITHKIIRAADGAIRVVNRRIQSIADKKGKVYLLRGTVHDITELYEKEMAQKSAALLLKKKDEFISIASHELKSPVTSLKMSLHLIGELLAKSEDNKKLLQFIKKTDKQTDKLTVLIDNLMDITRINEGKLNIKRSKFNLTEAIIESVEVLGDETKEKIKIEAENEVELYADRSRIQQVLTNYITNAIKYSPAEKDVRIAIETSDKEIKVLVTDKGIGIPTESLSKVFDRYYRVDEGSRQFIGLGLGLYISKEIIKKHNGEVGVASTLGQGSTFWFSIPVKS